MIIRRTSLKFQDNILRRVAVGFTQHPGWPMTFDLCESPENMVGGSLELELKYESSASPSPSYRERSPVYVCISLDEPVVKISAWSPVGTTEMVPEWVLEGV